MRLTIKRENIPITVVMIVSVFVLLFFDFDKSAIIGWCIGFAIANCFVPYRPESAR